MRSTVILIKSEGDSKMDKTEQILELLKAELKAGKYEINQRFPSEYELAERFGVNKKTANKAVSFLVSNGWLVRGKRGQGTFVTAVQPFPKGQLICISELKQQAQADFLSGAQAAAYQHDYLISFANPPFNKLKQFLEQLEHSPVKGIITGYYGHLDTKLPTVYMDRVEKKNEQPFYSVDCDNYQGGYEMMKLLLGRGHRDLVIFFLSELKPERLYGFYDAMKNAGISDFAKRTFNWHDVSKYEAVKQVKAAMKKFPRATAFVCGSDDLLFCTMQAFDYLEFKWKNKIALTGFGNLYRRDSSLPIASVDQHTYNVGFTAVEHLINLVEQRTEEVPLKTIIDVEIVNPGNVPLIQ